MRPSRIRINTPISGGTNVNVTLDTLSFTSHDTDVNAETNISVTLDTLSFTSYDAVVNAETNISVTLDTLSFTSYDAVVNAETNISVTLDVLSFTPFDTVVSIGTNVNTTLDTLSFTSHDTVVNAETNISVTLDVLSFTPFDTVVSIGTTVNATLDTLSFTSHDTVVNAKTNVNVTLDTLSFTSNDVVVNAETNVNTTLDTLSFAPNDVNISQGINVNATLDTLSFTSHDVIVSADTSVNATLDILSFTPYNVNITEGVIHQPSVIACENIIVSTVPDTKVVIDRSYQTIVTSIEEPTIVHSIVENTIVATTEDIVSVIHTGITGPQGEAGPIAGITEYSETLPYIGSGIGVNRTTTKTEGNLIYESFAVNGELFVNWLMPVDIERNFKQTFHGHIFSETSEVGTLSSWQIDVTSEELDGTQFTNTIFLLDAPLDPVAFEGVHATVEFPAGVFVTANTFAVHIKVKRIASSNDPSDGIGVVNIHMLYTSDGRVGAQGADGAPGGEDEVAQAKRTDFTNNDTIIYKGEAVPGTPDATSIWRVRRLTIASDNDVTEEWADGTADYIKVWDDRYTYTYS